QERCPGSPRSSASASSSRRSRRPRASCRESCSGLLEDLLAQEFHEWTRMRSAREPRHSRRAPNGDPIASTKVVLLLAIEGEDRGLVLRLELEHLIGIEHDRVAKRQVRRYRDQGDRFRRGKDERPADREAVGGAAGRGRDDEAVGPVDDERFAIDADRDVDRADLLAAGNNDIVQRERPHDLLAATYETRVE